MTTSRIKAFFMFLCDIPEVFKTNIKSRYSIFLGNNLSTNEMKEDQKQLLLRSGKLQIWLIPEHMEIIIWFKSIYSFYIFSSL